MLGLGKSKPVAEHEASGEIERVYHEIKPTLRVSGVNLNFRTWAKHEKFLPLMWDAVRPNAETRTFEQSADRVRAEAAEAAQALGPLGVIADVSLGESQSFQIRAALDLYHYVNPKLLVLTSAVRLCLEGERIGGEDRAADERIVPGVPAKMYPMEMESDEPDDARLQQLYHDIQETLSLPSVNSDYRTLALWPDYAVAMWRHLKPVVQTDEYRRLTDQLRNTSRSLARQLPRPLPLSRQAVQDAGEDVDAVIDVTERFEQLLPGLIVNVALCELDWRAAEQLADSPFPAATRQPKSRGAA